MLWSAEADTSAVLLTHAPTILPAADNLFTELRETSARSRRPLRALTGADS